MAPGAKPAFIEDISTSEFDSHLEIPTSGDPHHNATLTITLRYKLEFADSQNRVPGVIVQRENVAKALDGEQFAHSIDDWDNQSRYNFTRLMWRCEKIWNLKFMLITPRSYSGLDFPDLLPSHFVRPNVRCALRMEPWGNPHIKITVVRVTDPFPFTAFTRRTPPRHMLLDQIAPQTPILGHELGHVLGMMHIRTILGDKGCIADDNAPKCYGETAQELANIMGKGRTLWQLNAAPWLNRVALHTQTQAGVWAATMDMTTLPQRLSFAQHLLNLPAF
jgi:hypothetical protein